MWNAGYYRAGFWKAKYYGRAGGSPPVPGTKDSVDYYRTHHVKSGIFGLLSLFGLGVV